MPFADLLRRPSSRITTNNDTLTPPVASTSYLLTNASSSTIVSPPSLRRRFTFGRSAKQRPSIEADGDLLYPAQPTHPDLASNRTSRYSTTDDNGIGQAPARAPSLLAPSSKRRSAANSPTPSSLPASVSSPAVAPSLPATTSVNQHDRLFALSTASASVSPREPSIPFAAPLPPPTTSIPSVLQQHCRSTSATVQPSHQAPLSNATSSTTLLRSKSLKARSPFPPASSSTGTSSTHRDASTMGSAILRRSSFRRRKGSNDSSAEQQVTSPTPPVERRATSESMAVPVAANVSTLATAAASSEAVSATPSTGRLARFFGRRKSFSGPISGLHKPDLIADPVPVLRDATSSINVESPPLAVISAQWKDARDAKPLVEDSLNQPTAQSEFEDGHDRNTAALIFPARGSNSTVPAQQGSAATPSSHQRHAKHSTSHSLPLASMPVSSSGPLSASEDSTDVSAVAPAQPRPTRMGRSLSQSLSHRKNSKSLSMIGSMFGSSSSQTDSLFSSPPLPSAAATLSQRYPAVEKRASELDEPLVSSHSRKPSLRARLRVGRTAADQKSQRPTTPEIESWKQKPIEPVTDGSPASIERRSRRSIDGAFPNKPAESPVKIVRSRSTVRRKPPPEIKQEEIDSSSSTPVYSKTLRTLDTDHHDDGAPLGGSPASSPEIPFATIAGGSAARLASVSDVQRSGSDSIAVTGLGLTAASAAASKAIHASVPSIGILPGTPTSEASPKVAADKVVLTTRSIRQRLTPASSPALHGRRLSSGLHSDADTCMSLERPWSLISASEADTPLVKLRKLVVDTAASDQSHEVDQSHNELFFRPPPTTVVASTDATAKIPASEMMAQDDKEAEVMSEGGSTTRSDTKHDMTSNPPSSSSISCPGRGVPASLGLSGTAAASEAVQDACRTSLLRAGKTSPVHPPMDVVVDAHDRDADCVGPLLERSPAAPQHSLRSHPHRRDGSVASTLSQATIQQAARRSSIASRLTARSSGHWSESRLSEDALSALEAEVGQARRAEVIALGKGRVKDWVGGGGADRPLPRAEAPTLSRSNTMRKMARQVAEQDAGTPVDDSEAQRQKTLSDHLDRKLQQLSKARFEFDRNLDHSSQGASSKKHRGAPATEAESASPTGPQSARRLARLSAFYDRRPAADLERAAMQSAVLIAAPSSQSMEEAVRLGRAPSKRVRRDVSETRSLGEAAMVRCESTNTAEFPAAPSLGVARHLQRSASTSSKDLASAVGFVNPSSVPCVPSAPVLSAQSLAARPDAVNAEDARHDRKKHSQQRWYATSEEAARAKRLELSEREKRHAERDARRQAQLQQKYAQKKQNDPLLAARLALAGLESTGAVRQGMAEHAGNLATSKAGSLGEGLQLPPVPARRASSNGGARLTVAHPPMARKNSDTGSVLSFHTAVDAPVSGSVGISGSPLSKGVADASFAGGEVRPDTSYSIASSLAVDFEFPVPPQRMKEQLSDDGTLLSRAGLKQSPAQQWRERRHYARHDRDHPMVTPPRDSSLRDRTDSQSSRHTHVSALFSHEAAFEGGMSTSRTMPKLTAVSPLDSVKQTVALRRSRSVGYNSRDLRKLTREQMLAEASKHPSPPIAAQELGSPRYGSSRGLGIEMADDSRAAIAA